MGLEAATYINGLVSTNPIGASDAKSQGDDHIRLIKSVLKATFPNITGAVTKTQTQLNDAQIISLPTGTAMLFVQTAAPTGWTKSVTHNDKALRIVSGAAGSGGSVAFTTAFASKAVTGTNTAVAITEAQMPSHSHAQQGTFTSGGVSANHTHTYSDNTSTESVTHVHTILGSTIAQAGAGNVRVDGSTNNANVNTLTESALHSHTFSGTTSANSVSHTHNTTISGQTDVHGSDATHNHTFTGTAINLAVTYVDCIIATKD